MEVLAGPPREDDALSAVLRSVQVRRTLYCRSELRAPFAAMMGR